MAAHARLSASAAARWLNCPPSVRLCEQFPDKSSEYMEEGTFAHSMAEQILRYNNGEITKRQLNAKMKKMQENKYYSKELEEYISSYASIVWEQVNEARAACPDAFALFEQRVDFSKYVPDGFGTADVTIIADDTLQVIDLKYGKGVEVSAVGNPQLRLYGLGAYIEHSLLYDIRKIKLTIIQPRINNLSTEEISVEDLTKWAEDYVRPRAALAVEGKGDLCVGDHCRFCKAFAVCRAQKEYQMEIAKMDFADPDLLDDEEISDVLSRVDGLVKWAESVKDYAFHMALDEHVKFDGWKLVEGRSNRKYKDTDKIEDILTKEGYTDIFKPKELKGITEMTKLLGSKTFDDLLKDYIIKPPGKPVLVPESDKRPELNTVEQMRGEFE